MYVVRWAWFSALVYFTRFPTNLCRGNLWCSRQKAISETQTHFYLKKIAVPKIIGNLPKKSSC